MKLFRSRIATVLFALMLLVPLAMFPTTTFALQQEVCKVTLASGQSTISWPNSTDCPLTNGTNFTGNLCGSNAPDMLLEGSGIASTGSGATQQLEIRFGNASNGSVDAGNNYSYTAKHHYGGRSANDAVDEFFDGEGISSGQLATLPGAGAYTSPSTGNVFANITLGGLPKAVDGKFTWWNTSLYNGSATSQDTWRYDGSWLSGSTTAPITNFNIFWDSGNFVAGGTMYLTCSD